MSKEKLLAFFVADVVLLVASFAIFSASVSQARAATMKASTKGVKRNLLYAPHKMKVPQSLAARLKVM